MDSDVLLKIDAAFREDAAKHAEEAKPMFEVVAAQQQKFSALSRVLRFVGVTTLIAAAGVFLAQGWSGMDSVVRVVSFLGFTALLAAGGVFCGIGLKEDKGARTALALSTMLIPVIFSQLGALIYSLLPHVQSTGPGLFILTTNQPASVWFAAALGFFAIVPIVLLGFSSLARVRATTFAFAYGLANAVLLLPVRDADYVGLLSLGMLGSLTVLDLRCFHGDARLRNHEGRIARVLLFVPLLILIGRNLVMWAPSAIFESSVLAAIGLGLFMSVSRYTKRPQSIALSQGTGAFFLSLAWIVFAVGVFFLPGAYHYHYTLPDEYRLPISGLPVAALLLFLSFVKIGEGKNFRTLAGAVAIGTAILQLGTVATTSSSLLCIVTGIGCMVVSNLIEERALHGLGLTGLFVGIGYHIRYAVPLCTFSPWLSLATLGLVALVASSYLERNHQSLVMHIRKLRAILTGKGS